MCLALRRRGSLFRCTQGLALGNDERMRARKIPQLVSSIYCFAPAIDDTESNIGTYEPANAIENVQRQYSRIPGRYRMGPLKE
jgi:hypothetical protein